MQLTEELEIGSKTFIELLHDAGCRWAVLVVIDNLFFNTFMAASASYFGIDTSMKATSKDAVTSFSANFFSIELPKKFGSSFLFASGEQCLEII